MTGVKMDPSSNPATAAGSITRGRREPTRPGRRGGRARLICPGDEPAAPAGPDQYRQARDSQSCPRLPPLVTAHSLHVGAWSAH